MQSQCPFSLRQEQLYQTSTQVHMAQQNKWGEACCWFFKLILRMRNLNTLKQITQCLDPKFESTHWASVLGCLIPAPYLGAIYRGSTYK